MEMLWSRLDEKLNQQTKLITESVTKNVMEAMDERIKTVMEENSELKSKISKLEQKLNTMEKEKRKHNLVFFGIEENEKSEAELVDLIKETVIETGMHLDCQEISNVFRIGKKNDNKNRPILVSLTSTWKKHLILKNKALLPPGIYIKEDYPKEVLEKRKQLQLQVEEERKRGNIAFVKYDKLIVKKPTEKNRDKRKREDSGSPNSSTQKKVNTKKHENMKDIPIPSTTKGVTKDIIKPNILNYVERSRPGSLPEASKNF